MLANWPVVLIDLSASAFAKTTVIVPVAGGALMVGALVGSGIGERFRDGVIPVVEAVLASLRSSPEALAAFLVATALVWVASDVLVFVVKGGTLSVLVDADRTTGDLGRRVIGETELTGARRFTAAGIVAGARQFARPMVQLAFLRAAAYLGVGCGYLLVVAGAVSAGAEGGWPAAWSAVLLLATSASLVFVSAVNLACDLVRITIVTDDCSVWTAIGRVRLFVVEDARQVMGIVAVIAGIQIVASLVALLAAAGLAPVAYLPVVSLAVVPLQLAFWLVRGGLFEFAALSSVAACQTQYRRFAAGRFPSIGMVKDVEAP